MNSLLDKILPIKIDHTYCISIKERNDRRILVKQECKKINLKFQFALTDKDIDDPIRGCLTSHIYCINHAKQNKYKYILILEDDVKFDIENINNIINNKVKLNIPCDFDMLYLGYHMNNGYKYNDNVLKIQSTQTTHCYILNSNIYDYILENIEKDWKTLPEYNNRNHLEKQINWNYKAIDLFYSKWVHHKRNNSFGIYPILCYQYPNFSDIENRHVDYKSLLDTKANNFYNNIVIDEQIIKKIYVLNLDRRKDRWDVLNKKLKRIGLKTSKIVRYSAIDGLTYDFSNYLSKFIDDDWMMLSDMQHDASLAIINQASAPLLSYFSSFN